MTADSNKVSVKGLENRIQAASIVGEKFARSDLSEADRDTAQKIFQIMVEDAEVRVREALSASIKDNPNVPHDIAVSLANDVDEVSLPMLEFSEVLTDDDLVDIITNKDAISQTAIAKRKTVSEVVVDTLVEKTTDENVVATVLKNEGAQINEKSMDKVLDKYGTSALINEPMAKRNSIPASVAERLVSLVTDKVKEHLVTHHEMNPNMVTDLFFNARERATVGLLDDATDVRELVAQLYENNRLTETLIFRALCMGDNVFFDVALAKLAGIPVSNAYKLIHDKGSKGLEALFVRANISIKLIPIVSVALIVIEDMQMSASEDRARFKSRLLERILTECEYEIDEETLEYFIDKLEGGSVTTQVA